MPFIGRQRQGQMSREETVVEVRALLVRAVTLGAIWAAFHYRDQIVAWGRTL